MVSQRQLVIQAPTERVWILSSELGAASSPPAPGASVEW